MTGGQLWPETADDRLRDSHLLRDPGTPPVADSTVGIASTPSAIMVFNMIIVALILDVQPSLWSPRMLSLTIRPTCNVLDLP
jgi:hypothetical protein